MRPDIEIAQETEMLEIKDIAKTIDIKEDELENYGRYKAKIMIDESRLAQKEDGKLILVTAINPTSAGEGKSTVTIGLADGLHKIDKKVIACLREPSMGPVFGRKGGATGGGHAQVVPMEDINLHFTGDMHAISACNNLISAVLDNSIYQGNELNIDPECVVWKRCVDLNDRVLRDVTVGEGKKINGPKRSDHFCITVATEIMAILCLSKDLDDFKERVERCIVAYTYDGKEVTVKDLNISGSLCVLMKDALRPNLVQTLEHTPALVHGGPFANIAHGCNSIIATKTALKLADYVVTEAGFGADLGAEKFLDIKSRIAGLTPNVIVIVATIRALKFNGGVKEEDLDKEDLEALQKGVGNLDKHIDSMQKFGVPLCVAINHFENDSERELDFLKKHVLDQGVDVVLADGFIKGGAGMTDLAEEVVRLAKKPSHYRPLYDLELPLEEKIYKIASEIYGAASVEYSATAKEKLERYRDLKLPVCMAKTPNSLTDDPKILGRPEGFIIHVRDLSLSAGAGFIVVYTGNILTMPGLPKVPNAINIGMKDGKIFGLF